MMIFLIMNELMIRLYNKYFYILVYRVSEMLAYGYILYLLRVTLTQLEVLALLHKVAQLFVYIFYRVSGIYTKKNIYIILFLYLLGI